MRNAKLTWCLKVITVAHHLKLDLTLYLNQVSVSGHRTHIWQNSTTICGTKPTFSTLFWRFKPVEKGVRKLFYYFTKWFFCVERPNESIEKDTRRSELSRLKDRTFILKKSFVLLHTGNEKQEIKNFFEKAVCSRIKIWYN